MSLIKNYLGNHIAEVGPGNGTNLSYYIKFPKKIDLYEPSKKLFSKLKKNFNFKKKINFFKKKLTIKKEYYDQYYI